MIRGDFNPAAGGGARGRRKSVRRLAAILAADIMGYSALMAANEEQTHARVGAELERVFREIERAHGRIFSFAGDGLMAEFPSAVDALKCGLRIQAESARRQRSGIADERIMFRIGVNAGEIIVQDQRTGGNAVNVAARLEQLAEPGGICLSQAVFEQVRRVVAADYAFLGEHRLKNIKDPIAAYTIPAESCGAWQGMPTLPRERRAGPGVEYRPSLAVLPFRTLQPDQSDAYFAEGMVDDIIGALGCLQDLVVIARSSTQMFARAPLDLRRVGHELDVRYVLHGSVRRAGERLRTAVELSEAETGKVIWANRFDGATASIFDLQDRIAVRVATAIAPHLRDLELTRAMRKRPDSLTAYDLTLQALDLMYRLDRTQVSQARDLLAQANALDPDYAPAFSRLASLFIRWIGQGWSEDERADNERARDAAQRAIERDPNDALGLAIFGHYCSYLNRDYDRALTYLERAMAAAPSNAWAWSYGGLTAGYVGDIERAIERGERAVRLSPIGPDAFIHEHYLSQAYYLAGRYEEAAAWARMSDAGSPSYTSNLRCLIASLVGCGQLDEAKRAARRLLALQPTFRLCAFRKRTPLGDAYRDQFVERLQRAGLPA
jgi:TolB-like protein/class 3 adenylate cyclase/Tfp pilus assembly protein PilF